MPRFSSVYKQVGPTRRIVQGENTCEKGMCWSNSPLDAGYMHTILNYEIDQLTFNINVTGGMHTTDLASGCTFLDRATFGTDSDSIIVLQSRNEYNMRAFEGITNIISANKLIIKNNQTLEEQLRQQGFTADDVVCYKLLTYNPVNHRLMSVTLIQAKRDKFFVLDNLKLRRINSNPISCGFSEVWKTLEGNVYVSNKLNYHPQGGSDFYIPRARRNTYEETFGQKLHSTLYMQTVPNCEGYGNKTFCFTKKKQIDLEGPIKDTTKITYKTVTKIIGGRYGGMSQPGYDYKIGDIITITAQKDGQDITITPQVVKVTRLLEFTVNQEPTKHYGVADIELVSWGVFAIARKDLTIKNFKTTVTREGKDITSQITQETGWELSTNEERIIDSKEQSANTSQDIYIRNINTGVKENYNAILNNKNVPLDAFRFGKVLTGCALLATNINIDTATAKPALSSNLWDEALIKTIAPINDEALFKLNLKDGTLIPINPGKNISISLKALPYINRGVTGQPTTLVKPTDIFEKTIIENWGESPDPVHPSIWLKKNILTTLRKGQGFRIAAHCISLKNPERYLNTLREDPLDSKYYNEEVDAVFVLDYVWTGTQWEFSFVDTSVDMYDSENNELSLVEDWETDGQDEYGNLITRHYIWLNCLSYTDVLNNKNIDKLAKHLVDSYLAPKLIYNTEKKELYEGATESLSPNLIENIDSNLPSDLGLVNKSKLYDTSYAHFEVKPKVLTPGEAARWGYNMLSNTPYTFECINNPGTETASITGMLLKSVQDTNKVLLKPVVNTPGILEIYYNSDYAALSGLNYLQLKVEFKNPNDDWRILKNYTTVDTHKALSTGTPIQIPFTSPDENVLIRITLTDTRDEKRVDVPAPTDVYANSGSAGLVRPMVSEFLVVSQLITALSYTKDATKAEPSPEVFDLGSATGITYWKGRLVLWGVLGAENMLFMSEPNNPEYFAYPNSVDILEENIVHVIPYSDALIVFTSTKLWRIDLNQDGLSWTKTLLQQNLRISDLDIPYITILKNMLFFKSDKQFYMLVPARTATVGELNIAPISKSIQGFLENPFEALLQTICTIYPDLAGKKYTSPTKGTLDINNKVIQIPEKPITDYLIKYGVHTEQSRVVVDWWFDLSDWKEQTPHYSDNILQHDVNVSTDTNTSATYKPKEYWLVQLIYDTQTYGWTMRTHTTPYLGVFIADAVNQNTDFISLAFNNPESVFGTTKATWGISLNHRLDPQDKLINKFTLNKSDLVILDSSYPRFQVLDTGYKEVSSPALKKRFREVQLNFEPSPDTTEGLRSTLLVNIDGHTVVSSVSQELFEDTEIDPVTGTHIILKIVDRINYHDDYLLDPDADPNYVPLPYLVDGELSNTFVLDSSALAGVRNVKIRRQLNGKGYLARLRFINITHAKYKIANYAFVFHNKNAR